MHASVDQLIQIRDQQPVEASAATHVQSCATCSERLDRLRERREALVALPQLQPSAHVLRQVRRRLNANRIQYPRLTLVAATLVAALLISSWVMLSMRFNASTTNSARLAATDTPNLSSPVNGSDPGGAMAGEIAATRQLIEQSQSLELVIAQLAQLPMTPRNYETQQAYEALQNRLALLDYNLTQSQMASVTRDYTQQMWQRRVNTLQNIIDIQHADLAMQGYHGFQVVPVNNFDLDKTW